jgi:hypothetical protein
MIVIALRGNPDEVRASVFGEVVVEEVHAERNNAKATMRRR